MLTGVNYSAPAISPDGIVYVPCQFQIPFAARLNALTPSGNTNWSFKTGGGSISAPALGVDGTVYVVASGPPNILFSIRPDGGTNWMCSLGPSTNASASAQFPGPAIGPDGTIYVGSLDTNVYAISPQGKTNWIFRMQDKTFSSPAIGTDGTIYIGSDDQKLYALEPRGNKKWEYLFPAIIESSPAVGPDGTIYAASLGGMAWLDSGGNLLRTNSSFCSASPAMAADRTVYFVDFDTLRAWNSAGSNIWSVVISPGNLGFSSPTIGPDGTIYVAGGTNLWAIYGSSPPAQSPSPMFRRNALHTARSVQCALAGPNILSNRVADLTLTVETNRPYHLDASADLVNWSNLASFTSTNYLNHFLDSSATNLPQRFYRLATP